MRTRLYGGLVAVVLLTILGVEMLRRAGVDPTVAATVIAAVVALAGAAIPFVKEAEAQIASRAEAVARHARLEKVEESLDDRAADLARPVEAVVADNAAGVLNAAPFIHHVSLPVRNLERSAAFYKDCLKLQTIPRPDIDIGARGEWFQLPGGQQLHLIENAKARFRDVATAKSNVWQAAHFALRVPDLRRWYEQMKSQKQFLDIHPDVQFRRYPHFYILDPDNHVIEINATPPGG